MLKADTTEKSGKMETAELLPLKVYPILNKSKLALTMILFFDYEVRAKHGTSL